MLALHPLTDAVNFWVGPNQKKQDFTMNNLAIETKTSLSGDGSLIRISSLDQLDKGNRIETIFDSYFYQSI